MDWTIKITYFYTNSVDRVFYPLGDGISKNNFLADANAIKGIYMQNFKFLIPAVLAARWLITSQLVGISVFIYNIYLFYIIYIVVIFLIIDFKTIFIVFFLLLLGYYFCLSYCVDTNSISYVSNLFCNIYITYV